MQIPSKKKCYQLIREMEMMDHIVDHSIQVCSVTILLVDQLKNHGTVLNRDMVQAAALLHDITKTRSFKTGENHAETGCQFLKDLGYIEVGDIVRQHVVMDKYFAADKPSETEVVNYADKRVLHDKVVSLSKRMDYVLERYGQKPELRERLLWLREKTDEQEKRLFKDLPFSPEEVDLLIEKEGMVAEFSDFRDAQLPTWPYALRD